MTKTLISKQKLSPDCRSAAAGGTGLDFYQFD
jgi:hypothetical protein